MEPEVVNKNKNCVFNGSYAGRDLYITMLQELRQRIEEGRKSVLVSGMGGIASYFPLPHM